MLLCRYDLARDWFVCNKIFGMHKKHKNIIFVMIAGMLPLFRGCHVTRLGLDSQVCGGFSFDDRRTASVFYTSDDDPLSCSRFMTFFMTDTQALTIQERLVVCVCVWGGGVHNERRKFPDSKNLHVTCEEQRLPHVWTCGGRYVHLYCIFSQPFRPVTVLGSLMNACYI
jgi:hypothetical protein